MSVLELVRRIIRQQSDRIGQPVANLYGAVSETPAAILEDGGTTWNLAMIPGNVPVSIQDFYGQYSNNENTKYEKLTSTFGASSFILPKNESGTPYAFLLNGGIICDGNTVVPFAIAGGSATNPFTIFLDGVLQRTFYGEGSINLNLSAGKHVIEVIGTTDTLAIAVPSSVTIRSDQAALTKPVWEEVAGGYSDPAAGIPSARLRWYNDMSTGGWVVYRRSPQLITLISRVSDVDAYGKFSVEFSGDFTSQVRRGQEALTGSITIGTILGDSVDQTNTEVSIQLGSAFRDVDPTWVGQELYVATWGQIADKRNTGTSGLVEFQDNTVVGGDYYEYMLRPYGMFNSIELGPASDTRGTRAGDYTPPGSIVFLTGYPRVADKVVTVKFTTPSDLDYAGVYVHYTQVSVTGISSGGNTTTTLKDTTKALGTSSVVGSYVRITGGTGAGQFATIISNTATQFTISASTPWATIPDGTSTYTVYAIVPIVTDYGIPSATDEFTFLAPYEGTYYFRAFDNAGNVQEILGSPSWTYTPVVEAPIPNTQLVVNNRSSTGKVESNLLGITVYAVPAASEVVLDTFDVSDGTKFVQQYSSTSDASGNTTTTVKKTGAGWTVNAYANKWVQLTSGVMVGKQAKIVSNTSTVLSLATGFLWPVTPDSVNFKIWDQVPDKMPVSTLGVGAGTENWNLTDTTTVLVNNGHAVFLGPQGKLHEMYLDSTLADKFRYELTINRGGLGHFSGAQITGSNLTYRGDTTNANRWEFGITHSSDAIVNIRYRYLSGGAGTWFGLYSGYAWGKNTPQKLVIELDGNVHTFKIADAFGHNELILGRVTSTAGSNPAQTKVGWQIRGNSGDDWIDNTRVLNISDLVNIKYSVSPDEDDLQNVHFTGTVTSGSTAELNDLFKQWITNELVNDRVLITAGPGKGDDRRIVSNTSNRLIPDTPFSAALTTSSTYIVYATQYEATERAQFWRQSSPLFSKSLKFHGERAAAAPEVEKRVLLDANTIPELSMTVSKITEYSSIATADLSIQIYPDDDVKRWEFYMRKGGNPTFDGTQLGVLDPQYKRFDVPAVVTQRTVQVGTGTWYCAAVGYDSNGTPGIVVFQTIVVAITGVVDTALSNLTTSAQSNSVVRLQWQHTSDVESPSAVATLNIYATDSVSNTRQLLTSGTEVWREGAGQPNSISGSGYFDDANYVIGNKTDPRTSVVYEIELYLNTLYKTTYTTTYSFHGTYLL